MVPWHPKGTACLIFYVFFSCDQARRPPHEARTAIRAMYMFRDTYLEYSFTTLQHATKWPSPSVYKILSALCPGFGLRKQEHLRASRLRQTARSCSPRPSRLRAPCFPRVCNYKTGSKFEPAPRGSTRPGGSTKQNTAWKLDVFKGFIIYVVSLRILGQPIL